MLNVIRRMRIGGNVLGLIEEDDLGIKTDLATSRSRLGWSFCTGELSCVTSSRAVCMTAKQSGAV